MSKLLWFIWVVQYKHWSENTSYMRFVVLSWRRPSIERCVALVKGRTVYREVNTNWLSVIRLSELNANPYFLKD